MIIDNFFTLSTRELKRLFRNDEPSLFYDEAAKLANDMAVHAFGKYPEELIECRRPNEAEEVKEYRKKIFVAKTKPTFDKIVSALGKIRRSNEWGIIFDDESRFTRVADTDRLSVYTSTGYPQFDSVTNWVFSACLKKYLVDPNAVCVVIPEDFFIEPGELYKPVATIFDAENVLHYDEGEIVILENPVGSYYRTSTSTVKGKSFYVITRSSIIVYNQINSKFDFSETVLLEHDHDFFPAFKLQAIIKDQHGKEVLYESRISGIVPELDEALREYSDLQAAKVLHLYPERYQYTNTECRECNGNGKTLNSRDPLHVVEETCSACHGVGFISPGPFVNHLIKPAGVGEQALPTPPIGYATKDIEIIKVQEQSVENHIYSALSAVNLEFIARVPLSESGVAKNMDRDESNNTINAIAEDIVRITDKVYYLIAKWRHAVQYTDDEIKLMLPSIAVPERFDIASASTLSKEVADAKSTKINPVVINKMEIDLANKRFYNEPAVRERLELVLSLDPLSNISEDDKLLRLQNKGITKLTYVISSNISELITEAMEQNKTFVDLERSKQKEILESLAQKIIDANDSAKEVIPRLQNLRAEDFNDDDETDNEDE